MPKNENKYSFRLKWGRDDGIIEWLESVGKDNVSYYIREGLRAYLRGELAPLPTKSSAGSIDLTEKGKERKVEPAIKKEKDTVIDDRTLETNLNNWFEE